MDVTQPLSDTSPAGRASSWLGARGLCRLRQLVAGVALAAGAAPAAAQPAATAPNRAASLLPPKAADTTAARPVARGAIDDTPAGLLATTPVIRPVSKTPAAIAAPRGGSQPTGPAWLTGVDPAVVPAGGTGGKLVAPLTPPRPAGSARMSPPPMPPDNGPSLMTKGINSLKSMVGTDRPAAADMTMPPAPPPADPRGGTGPNAPLQATGTNGAPVLAGPPAWRWYGYGSVTPGANALAPAGQYPRASANWYSVTRATPGAFPVPVVNPYRPAPGSEPPAYLTGMPTRPGADIRNTDIVAAAPPNLAPPPMPAPLFTPPAPSAPPLGASKFSPALPLSSPEPRLISAPTTPAPLTGAAGVEAALPLPSAPQPPVGVPSLAPPPGLAPSAVAAPPMPPAKPPEPIAAIPPAKLPDPIGLVPGTSPAEPEAVAPPALMPVIPTEPAPLAAAPTTPLVPPLPAAPLASTPLPVPVPAAAPDEVGWKANPDKPAPVPTGTWLPAGDKTRTPGTPAGGPWQPGATNTTRQPVARGQAPDADQQADPAAELIRALCRGRAADVDVRPTGPKRLTVCFEARTQSDAAGLVRDISGRPELAPFQIDFCVLVK